MVDRQPLAAVQARMRQERPQDRLVSDQNDWVKLRVLVERQLDGRNHLGRAEVATHGVDCDPSGSV